jgi:8-oxo-dGTP pyrophosphatase MutT (NUDIX family)
MLRDKYKTINSETIYSNPYWEYKLDKYIMPSGREGFYHYVHSRGATLVVPLTASGKLVCTVQHRYLNQKLSIEFPGGGIKEGLLPIENAREELKEETGYEAQSLEKIGEYNPFNGVTNEICSIFVAKDLQQGNQILEESEEIHIIELTQKEFVDKIRTNEIWDGMTLAAWSLFSANYLNGGL